MFVFTVRVTHTDRSRTADGHFNKFYTSVEVAADTDIEATLIAAQMASAIRRDIDGMVIGTTIEEVAA